MAAMAIYRGFQYYYSRHGRPMPSFADFAASDADERIARSLGLSRRCHVPA
jgi:hypothetical protein